MYVKNQFPGFAIPYLKDGKDKNYFTDFIARVDNSNRETVNLIIEISGMSKDKAKKKWYVENRWIPAVNAVQEKYNLGKWHFIEIANDIRDIRNQLTNLYGVETKVLKRAVRRNIDRFPEDFMFELTTEEWKNLRSHFGTSSEWGGTRYPPFVFTEQGVAMLSSLPENCRPGSEPVWGREYEGGGGKKQIVKNS